MTPLFLLRHGPTTASQGGAPLGRLDLPVEPGAQAQWLAVKSELRALGLQRIVTSDLIRARHHAQELAAELELTLRVFSALGEQDFGAWDGVPWAEIRGSEAFFADPVNTAPPGGESFAACAERTRSLIPALLEDASPLLILAHGGPLRAILATFLGLPLDRTLDLAWQPFGLTRVDVYSPDRALLQFHNQPLG
jgi:broad specificity phosphatase PhoE